MRIFFSSIIDAWVNLERSVPLRVEKTKKQNKKKNAKSIYLENFKVLFLRNPRELGFLYDYII